MKNKLKNSIILFLAAVFILSSCAQKMHFAVSAVAPAATGIVKIKKDNNSNYNISLKINNLASSDRLTPSKKAYIVWMITENSGTKNIGQLQSNSKFLSSKLKASLQTVTAFKPNGFFITGEDETQIRVPSGNIVLQTVK